MRLMDLEQDLFREVSRMAFSSCPGVVQLQSITLHAMLAAPLQDQTPVLTQRHLECNVLSKAPSSALLRLMQSRK